MSQNKCVICNGELPEGYPGRNNPQPVKESGECCDRCNSDFVIPIRLRRMLNAQDAAKASNPA